MVDFLRGAPIPWVIWIFWGVPIQLGQQQRRTGVESLLAGLFDVDGRCLLLQLHPRLVVLCGVIHCRCWLFTQDRQRCN